MKSKWLVRLLVPFMALTVFTACAAPDNNNNDGNNNAPLDQNGDNGNINQDNGNDMGDNNNNR
ncbi:MAG TPA: hypothetical protein VIG73_06060 [Cerasibacillus sp.]|uniref:hypothetical protein n=1 Tax=Cerasibacillus sp. TaxID=2498711 RepID=UPI002F3EC7DD